MSVSLRSVCLVASGLAEDNARLQPWRYLLEVARQLALRGHAVSLISDGARRGNVGETLSGLPMYRLNSIRAPMMGENPVLASAIERISPDVLLWHVGLASFAHQSFRRWADIPQAGILSSPIYTSGDFLRLGLAKTIRNLSLTGTHLFGTLMPGPLLHRGARDSGLRSLVFQTVITCEAFKRRAGWRGRMAVIPPGVDGVWHRSPHHGTAVPPGADLQETITFAYLGSPAELRGLPVLLKAFALARQADPALRLLVLSRRRGGELEGAQAALRDSIAHPALRDAVRLVDGLLSPAELVEQVEACDAVTLPFELVPSDAPLAPLEALALGKPLITTRVACLPELASAGPHYLACPGDPASLCDALLAAARGCRLGQVQARPTPRLWSQVGEEWSTFVQSL